MRTTYSLLIGLFVLTMVSFVPMAVSSYSLEWSQDQAKAQFARGTLAENMSAFK